MEQGEDPCHLFNLASRESLGLVYFRNGDCRVNVLGEKVLEEACVCPAQDIAVVGVEMYVHDVLVMGANYSDSGGKTDLYRGVHGGYHGVCVGAGYRYDEFGEL